MTYSMGEHQMGPSTLNHGESQCVFCKATNREIYVIGYSCPEKPTEPMKFEQGDAPMPKGCICSPMDYAALGHMVDCPCLKTEFVASLAKALDNSVVSLEEARDRAGLEPAMPAHTGALYDVAIEGGKYRFVYLPGGGVEAYRYGQRWEPFEQLMFGSKAIFSLVARVAELEGRG